MGGEEKNKRTAKQAQTSTGGAKYKSANVSDAEMCRLLNHFSSAELLPQSCETSEPDTNRKKTNFSCDDVITSFKHLHLRRPELLKHRRLKKKKSQQVKQLSNVLNLAVAAGNVQKPIVRPARLNCTCKKQCGAPSILHPARLNVTLNHSDGTASAVPVMKHSRLGADSCSCQLKLSTTRNSTLLQCNNSRFGDFASASSLTFSSICREQGKNSTLSTINTDGSDSSKICHGSSHPQQSPFTGQQVFTNTPLSQLPSSALFRADALLHPIPSGACGPHTNPNNSVELSATVLPNQQQSTSCLTRYQALSSTNGSAASRSCSQEVRIMEDTNVNELASYLEDLLHIPRKMSTMAEMMYA